MIIQSRLMPFVPKEQQDVVMVSDGRDSVSNENLKSGRLVSFSFVCLSFSRPIGE